MKFNPDVPEGQTPDFQRSTQPISPVEGNRSFQTLFSGIGDLFERGVQGADFIVKNNIVKKLQPQVDAEREAFAGNLNQEGDLYRALGGSVNRGQQASPTDDSSDVEVSGQRRVLPNDRVPAALESLPDQVERYYQANQQGRIPSTYYTGRLISIAKSLRQQYPGYRDFIDREISRIVGFDPANKQISDLMKEDAALKRSLNTTDNFDKQVMTKALTLAAQGQVEVTTAIEAFRNKKISSMDLLNIVTKNQQYKATADRTVVEASRVGAGDKIAASRVGTSVDTDLGNMMESLQNGMMITLGGGDQIKFHQNMLEGKRADGTPLSIQEQEAVIGALGTLKTNYIAQANKYGRAPVPGSDMNIVRALGGPDEFNKRVNANVAFLDYQIDRIRNKDYGSAYRAAREVKLIQDEVTRNMLDPSVNSSAGLIQVASAANDLLKNSPAGNLFVQSILQRPGGPLTDVAKTDINAIIVQPGLRSGASGQPSTFQGNMERYQKSGIAGPKDLAKVAQSHLRLAEGIANNSLPDDAKYGIMQALYSPQNLGWIAQFKTDTVDANGRPVPGAYAAYGRSTSLKQLQETKRISEIKDNGKTFDNAANWVEHSFARELFPREIRDLNNINADKYSIEYVPAGKESSPMFVVSRKPVTRNPDAPANVSPTYGRADDAEFEGIQRSLNRLNYGLRGPNNLYQVDKERLSRIPGNETVDRYVLDKLINLGDVNIQKIKGSIPEAMAAAILKKQSEGKKELTPQQRIDQSLGVTGVPSAQ